MSWWYIVLCALLSLILAFLYKFSFPNWGISEELVISYLTIVIPIFAILVPLRKFINDLRNLDAKKNTNENKVQNLQATLDEDFFNKLIKINFNYIDKYYLQTQIQASKSFALSVFTCVVSFFIIIVGIYFVYLGKLDTAIVTTTAGVLTEFIAAVFFYLYNKTIIKMGEYHHKLVLTQNVSLALKITEEMEPAEKAKAQMHLVEQLSKDINMFIASKEDK